MVEPEGRLISTKFLLVSDTQGVYPLDPDSGSPFRDPLPDCDVLVHAGDMSSFGKEKEYTAFFQWLCGINAEVKIVIAGSQSFSSFMSYIPFRFPPITYLFFPSYRGGFFLLIRKFCCIFR